MVRSYGIIQSGPVQKLERIGADGCTFQEIPNLLAIHFVKQIRNTQPASLTSTIPMTTLDEIKDTLWLYSTDETHNWTFNWAFAEIR